MMFVFVSSLVFTSCKQAKKETAKPAEKKAEMKVAQVDYSKFGIANTNDNIPTGLTVNVTAPNVTLTDKKGNSIHLSDLYKKQPIVLFFYRGYWCPYCNKQLSTFAKQTKKIEDKGVKLVAITPESYDGVAKTRSKTGANFTIFSDKNDSIMKAFKVNFNVTQDYQNKILKMLKASIKNNNANGKAILPVPATFIINTQGKIVYKQFNPDYKERATIDDILTHLPK